MSEEEKQAIRKEEDKVLQEKNPGQKIVRNFITCIYIFVQIYHII